MNMLLLIVYICLFILNICLLVRAMRPFSIGKLFGACLSEFGSLMAALLVMWIYDQAPGYGIMPGLSYIQEVFYSFCAAVIFAGLLLIFIVIGVVGAHKKAKE